MEASRRDAGRLAGGEAVRSSAPRHHRLRPPQKGPHPGGMRALSSRQLGGATIPHAGRVVAPLPSRFGTRGAPASLWDVNQFFVLPRGGEDVNRASSPPRANLLASLRDAPETARSSHQFTASSRRWSRHCRLRCAVGGSSARPGSGGAGRRRRRDAGLRCRSRG